MGVTLQDFNGVTVSDVIKADPIGCQNLITHFDAVLLCKATRVQPEKIDGISRRNSKSLQSDYFHYQSEVLWSLLVRA